jgi:hypothetical protein
VRRSLPVRMLGSLFLGFCRVAVLLAVRLAGAGGRAVERGRALVGHDPARRLQHALVRAARFQRLRRADYSLEIGMGVAVLGTILGLWLALALEGRDRRGLGASSTPSR